ncbi:uncharacterized protein LOC112568465 [Pomacea canaliculata]|uniref:uncharacterized protein LOC112568465 n=1 Tax=Pomacea canaliculata TaxID=400727 RepID=UPI000D729340|nr:uncharacterized protein LOC112568465 [Pomacea canaliculata]
MPLFFVFKVRYLLCCRIFQAESHHRYHYEGYYRCRNHFCAAMLLPDSQTPHRVMTFIVVFGEENAREVKVESFLQPMLPLLMAKKGFRTTTTEDERPSNSLFTPVRLPGVQLPEVLSFKVDIVDSRKLPDEKKN